MSSTTSTRGACVALLLALLIQAASAQSCVIKGKLSGKEASPGKGKFKGTFCWDGLTTPQSVATVTWTVSSVTNYRYSVIGAFSSLSSTSAKAFVLSPDVSFVKSLTATASLADIFSGLDLLNLISTICTGKAGVGIVAEDASGALKVIASAQVVLPSSAQAACAPFGG